MIHNKRNYDITKIGGKAGALAKLSTVVEEIPNWFVADDTTTDEEVLLALEAFPEGTTFAVRSSGVTEDGVEHSFAGQFESYLNVKKSQVLETIEKVKESGFSERVKAYALERGIDKITAPAALVQQMVNAEIAGVAFAVNPVTGNTKECVISAVAGLGDKLVDGSVDGETYLVSGNTVKLESILGEETAREDILSENTTGKDTLCEDITSREKLNEEKNVEKKSNEDEHVKEGFQENRLLTDEQCMEIAALCKKTSQHFGRFQDIEWAYENGQLYLLQSRPITSLGKYIEKLGYISIWDNSNIAESYNGVTTPLTFSFIRLAYEHVYREMCRMLGVKEEKIEDNDYIFTHMLGLMEGQVYYNLLSWYKLIAILPGYKTNGKFMEQMMGVKEELPEEVRKLLPPPSDATMFTAIRKLWGHYHRNEGNVNRFFQLLDDTIKTRDLRDFSLFDLAAYYRQLESKLLKHWDAPVINDFFAMIFYGLLKSTSNKWCGIEDENKFNGLLRDTGEIISAEPAKRVCELAELICHDEGLVTSLLKDEPFTIQQKLPSEAKVKVKEYLDKFGDRCINELKLESETLMDNPLLLYRAIGNFAVKINSGKVQEVKDNFDEDEIIQKAGSKKILFKWILKNARRTVRNRENLRFERTRLFGTIRSIFKEIGMHLASFGVIDEREDIFYLECSEVLAYIEGTATTLDLRGLIQVRKKEYAIYEGLLPDRFETYDCVSLSGRHVRQTEDEVGENSDILKGLGCCPGIVRGAARVITNPKDAVIYPGEILVAQRTDPGWIMLFPVAAGVLVEYGSLLSHAAIVVREMGIPAVVSVKNLFANVQTGDILELDGEKGVVTIIERKN